MKLLFSQVDIFSVLEYRRTKLEEEVEHLDPSTLERAREQELVRDLASTYKMEVPALEEDMAYVSHRETRLDVSRDPMRLIFDRSQPFYIQATEITFSI